MKVFQKFISSEATGGFYLLFATIIAMLWSNSPFSESYTAIVSAKFTLHLQGVTKDILLSQIINDGLMTLFFFLIGLEIKRELMVGALNTIKKAILPAIAAVGGMVFPALIYLVFNHNDAIGIQGWAIPTATDIAFSLAILSLLGRSVPMNLKIFLTALAIFDDLGAICIIAIFYTREIIVWGIVLAFFLESILIGLNKFKIIIPTLYFLIGFLMWYLFAISGVHPTLAGVLVAFTIPLKSKKPYFLPLNYLERIIHPWVIFLILPLFAFTNAGISFQGFFDHVTTPISLGIALGLFLGKQWGVFCFSWMAIQSKIAEFPKGITWGNFYGIALLCGIGFTMSFFIGFLSFDETMVYQSYVRAGVLCGSIMSGIFGYLWLQLHTRFFEQRRIERVF